MSDLTTLKQAGFIPATEHTQSVKPAKWAEARYNDKGQFTLFSSQTKWITTDTVTEIRE